MRTPVKTPNLLNCPDTGDSPASDVHLAGVSDTQVEAFKKKVLACFNQVSAEPEPPSSAADLAKILAEHSRWLKSVIDPKGTISGKRAILRGVSLRGAKLADADLRGADLRNSDFSGADLQRCNLSMADLSNSDLTGALMSGAILTGTETSGIDLSVVELNEVIR